MIFSKDKKPTEAGWYWACVHKAPKRPFPIEVWESHLSRGLLLAGSRGMRMLNTDVLWGDRVLVPTVESPVVEGAEA